MLISLAKRRMSRFRVYSIDEKLTIARTVAARLPETASLRAAARHCAETLGVSSWTAIKFFYQLQDNQKRGVGDPFDEQSAFRIGSEHVNLIRRKRYRERIDGDPEFLERTRRLRAESAARIVVMPYVARRASGDVAFLCRRLIAFARSRSKRDVCIHPRDLEALFHRQRGVCPLTGLQMQLAAPTRHPLVPSLDRIDPNVGYIPNNVRFVCYFANLLKRDFTDQDVFLLLDSFHTKMPEQGPLPEPRSIDTKLRACFRNAMRRTRDYKWTTDLHITDLRQLYSAQQGRCAITRRILSHVPVTPFSLSIDRIDSAKHYTKDNIHLVCLSVNIAKLDYPLADFVDVLDMASRGEGITRGVSASSCSSPSPEWASMDSASRTQLP